MTAWRSYRENPLIRQSSARLPDFRERLRWVLGDEPAGVPFPARRTLDGRSMTDEGWLASLYGRPFKADSMKNYDLGFGDDLKGDLYVPAKAAGKLPVVIWLHPYAYPTGYSRYTRPTFLALTEMGYAVLAFDQIGFGTRIHQAERFYERYPHWSLLGKMVADTRAAVDALAALEEIDASRIYLAGYSLGGKVALFTAALDDRIAGVIAASAFTPLRTVSRRHRGSAALFSPARPAAASWLFCGSGIEGADQTTTRSSRPSLRVPSICARRRSIGMPASPMFARRWSGHDPHTS